MSRDPDDRPSNPQSSRSLNELAFGRREAMKLAAGAAAALAAGSCAGEPYVHGPSSLPFAPLEAPLDARSHVAAGYREDVVIRWGDPLFADAPAFNPAALAAADQERQFGYNNDFLAFLPLPKGSGSSDRGLLCANHEYTNPRIMWPGIKKPVECSREQVDYELAAHGHSVVEVERVDGRWRSVPSSRHNRRLSTRSTRVRISGPAAGDARMKTSADDTGTWVLGLLNT